MQDDAKRLQMPSCRYIRSTIFVVNIVMEFISFSFFAILIARSTNRGGESTAPVAPVPGSSTYPGAIRHFGNLNVKVPCFGAIFVSR